MKLDLIDKSITELAVLLIDRIVSVVDKQEGINVQRAIVSNVGTPTCPAFWTNEGKVCVLDTDVGEITIWDTSQVETVRP